MKDQNPFEYSYQKALKKIKLHERNREKLSEFTTSADNNRFKNRMLKLLERTNERVTLDRPFLIQEKMAVIMRENDLTVKK